METGTSLVGVNNIMSSRVVITNFRQVKLLTMRWESMPCSAKPTLYTMSGKAAFSEASKASWNAPALAKAALASRADTSAVTPRRKDAT